MNRKTKIIVSVSGILIVLLALIGLTYAYFLTRINGNSNSKSISISTDKLELTYSDNSSEIIGSGKTIQPSSEPIGEKEFTVTNNGGDTNYSVVLEDMSIKDATTNEETTFESNDFRYTLTCKDKSGNNCGSTITEQTELPLISVALLNNDIAKGDIHTYTLTIWYLETGVDQSNDMGKSISAKINIIDPVRENPYKNNKNTLAYNIINNAILQKNGTSLVSNTKTIPAQEPTMAYVEGKPGSETTANFTTTRNVTSSYYFTYGDTFTYTTSHTISNKDGSALKAIQLSSGYTTLKGKYIVSYSGSSSSTPVSGSGKSTIYYVMDATSSSITYTTVSAGLKQMERYITYGDSYKFNKTTGKYDIVNKDGSALKTVKYSENLDELKGKYIVSTSGTTSSTPLSGANEYIIYQVTNNSTTTQLKYTSITKSNTSYINLESTLSMATDDYGTSYYYRGGVEDNYVNFAGMCWRIVRIEGDGSTKLILEDRSAECNSSSFTGNWGDGSYIKFGFDSNYRLDFLNDSGGLADSLKSFQTTLSTKVGTGKTLSNYLKVDDWCYDYNVTYVYFDSSYDIVSSPVEGGFTAERYGAYTRLNTDKKPSLVCTGTKLNKYRDNTDMYVGTLTADEIAYAGGTVNARNIEYYLMNSYAINNNLYWLTISPRGYGDGYDYGYAFMLTDYGKLDSDSEVIDDTIRCSRPSVTLLPSTQITVGNGTIENPYTVG